MAINCFAMPLTGLPTRRMRFNCVSVASGMSEKSMVPELWTMAEEIMRAQNALSAGGLVAQSVNILSRLGWGQTPHADAGKGVSPQAPRARLAWRLGGFGTNSRESYELGQSEQSEAESQVYEPVE
jgi:hypothetical protein